MKEDLLQTFNLIFVVFHDFMKTHHKVTHQWWTVFLKLTTQTKQQFTCNGTQIW